MGFFPESYVEVGSTSTYSQSPTLSAPSTSYTDGPIGGSPVSVTSLGQTTLPSTKYGKLTCLLFRSCAKISVFTCTNNWFLVTLVNINVLSSWRSVAQNLSSFLQQETQLHVALLFRGVKTGTSEQNVGGDLKMVVLLQGYNGCCVILCSLLCKSSL